MFEVFNRRGAEYTKAILECGTVEWETKQYHTELKARIEDPHGPPQRKYPALMAAQNELENEHLGRLRSSMLEPDEWRGMPTTQQTVRRRVGHRSVFAGSTFPCGRRAKQSNK